MIRKQTKILSYYKKTIGFRKFNQRKLKILLLTLKTIDYGVPILRTIISNIKWTNDYIFFFLIARKSWLLKTNDRHLFCSDKCISLNFTAIFLLNTIMFIYK